ncbi:hypothetical protein [Enterovirga aerilata]|uniref:DUF2946 domain-containing protein n=1 Tax=Enterovirga aerilata TaxID=2730920 RepID=A0A849I4Q5_9HYPH|nr:hypothetical protein [Enterovirga sp. DB1703]NNM72684.1 hypothetical protein [Enterovirga sp. DB1703]
MRWRAIVGAIALYAVLLQAFVAAATPTLSLDGRGILCTEHGPGQPEGGGAPARHDHHCCLPGHGPALAPPPGGYDPVSWRTAEAIRIAWRPEADLPRTGPPEGSHTARGPPLA